MSKISIIATELSQPLSWQQQLSQAITSPEELLKVLNIPPNYLNGAQSGAKEFAIRVPMAFINRMEKGNINDPLLRQVLPLAEETQLPPDGFVLDPLEENISNATPGIIHKYKGRVLLITNGTCAVNCRYCFRRHFPYEDNRLNTDEWTQALDYIRVRPDINEVILSGGDPLTNNDQRLFSLISAIENIPHITRLRIHTRLPIVIPDRITHALVKRLSGSSLAIVMVVHVNHANELGEDVANALHLVHKAGIHLLNQSVLLKGVNDSVDSLIALSERLFTCHILPYYLHLLDPVIGAHHFDISKEKALSLVADILTELPGFLVPKLVQEIPGKASKTAVLHPNSPK
ncbi:MAG: EF-P beta-lysylation protein EpmB [Bermanella sp.]|jgi:EF-P beta-lysylation protein EpmB